MRLSTYIQRTEPLGSEGARDVRGANRRDDRDRHGFFDDVLALRDERLSPRMLLGLWRAGQRHRAHQITYRWWRRVEEREPAPIPCIIETDNFRQGGCSRASRAPRLSADRRSTAGGMRSRQRLNFGIPVLRSHEKRPNSRCLIRISQLDEGVCLPSRRPFNLYSHRWLGIRRGNGWVLYD